MLGQIVAFKLVAMWAQAECLSPLKFSNHFNHFLLFNKIYSDLSVTITAGPTREAIDPVRYISNTAQAKWALRLPRPLLNEVQMSP